MPSPWWSELYFFFIELRIYHWCLLEANVGCEGMVDTRRESVGTCHVCFQRCWAGCAKPFAAVHKLANQSLNVGGTKRFIQPQRTAGDG